MCAISYCHFFFAVPSNAFIRIHISGIRQCGFCTNSYKIIHTNCYTNCITNSYMMWFLYQFIQILYELYSTNSYKTVLYKFGSRISIKQFDRRNHRRPKNRLPPLPRYVGTCKIMYEKILDTIHKSGLSSSLGNVKIYSYELHFQL